jgi:hypothetical protein
MTATTRTRPRRGRVTNLALARRTGNLERTGIVGRLRCECPLPECNETVPALAETHRGILERFIVVPAHLGGLVAANALGATVVRAADRFFVVDLRAGGSSPIPPT